MSRKWIIIGENAYLSCPCCSAFPMRDYGRDEYGNYLLQCRRCGILVVRKTQPTKLRKSALKRFWGEATFGTGAPTSGERSSNP